MFSILLDRTTWDLVLDADGNIAVASAPYAVLQDVCCAIRTMAGECWYDTSQGIPYLTMILGQGNTAQTFKSQAEAAALTVPLVQNAVLAINSIAPDRRLTGVVQVTLTTGETLSVGIN